MEERVMSEEKVLVLLVVVAGIIALIYFIYKSVQDNKIEEEIQKAKEQHEKEMEEIKTKERKRKSVEWNKKIQDKFDKKIKYETNKPIKVIIGDYHDWMAPLTNSILKSMGIETEVVPTASDIIDRITDGKKYDFIITNNTYSNGESGQDVLVLKEQENFTTPIIVLTVEQNQRSRFISDGFDDYIEKPIDEEKVKKVFTKYMKDLKFNKIKSSKSK